MRTSLRRACLPAALIALLASAASAADEVELKPQFKAGTTRLIEMTEVAGQEMSGEMLGDQTMKSESGSIHTFEEKVLDASADLSKVQIAFQRVMMKLSHPMAGSHAFDTDSGEKPTDDNSMALVAAPWVGKALTFTIDAAGEVKKVEGLDELRKAVDQSAMGDTLYEQMKEQMLGEDTIKQQFWAGRLAIFPGKKVKVADTWQKSIQTKSPTFGTMDTRFDCKLDKIEKRDGRTFAVVAYTATSSLPAGAEVKPNAMGAMPSLKTWTAQGTATIDVELGQIDAGKSELKADISLSMNAPDGSGTKNLDVSVTRSYQIRVLSEAERAKQKEEAGKPSAG